MSPSKRGASIEPIEPQTRPSVGVVTVTDMDTVQEENDNDSDESSYSDVARLRERTHQMLSVPTVQEPLLSHSQPGSRRASELESKITANLNTRERTHQMLSVPTVQEPLLSHSQPGSRMASELESKITANLNTRERTHQMLSVPTVQEPLLSHSQPGSRMASELESKITANLNTRERTHQMLSVPTVQEPLLSHSQPGSRRASELESKITANLNTRRPSAIIAAFRRPSQALALCAATQKRFLSEMGPHSRASVASTTHEHPPSAAEILGHESLSKALSALYAKLLVVLGLAFPVTEVIANGVPNGYYQGFYLYLYSVSVLFVIFQYANLMRQKAVTMIVHEYGEAEKGEKGEKSDKDDKNEKNTPKKKKETISRYGSFYLRLGAIAFGIGSMVYSGLEFGEYFEKNDNCRTALSVITPALRMALTLLQMQFIFLTNKDIESGAYKLVQRFGFMHMLATNLCEWLYVLVAETKHEIHHLEHTLVAHEGHNETAIICRRSNIMGSLLHNASPFLFPCTIEYSLICAVILYEMWKEVHCTPEDFEKKFHYTKNSKSRQNSVTPEKILQQFAGMLGVGSPYGSRAALHQFSVDCSHAHRGLFAGVLLIVLTIISLIMFFVLASNPNTINDAIFQVNICELILYTLTIIVAATALFHMRALPYKRKSQAVLGLDTSLLILAQTGMFVYCMFSLIGSHHTLGYSSGGGLTGFFSEFLSLNQTILQSLFIIDAWWRRCSTSEQRRDKPGRQLVTFLLVANMAMWAINTLEKNRAEFRPAHLQFYGPWAWTIITHVSMPLAIFYRFHSTICLFEIWKNSFKSKPIYLNVS